VIKTKTLELGGLKDSFATRKKTTGMFAFGEKNVSLKAEKLCDIGVTAGVNRRAIGLMPMPISKENHEVFVAGSVKYTNLLLSIESRQSSCCLRIVSSARKTRSAILIYRGRVIGCIYGQKGREFQLFGQEAYQQAMIDLAQPNTLIDAYLLSEEIILSAASLFQGNVNVVQAALPAEKIYIDTVNDLLAKRAVACVVTNNKEGLAKCITYLFAGKIVGVYSFAKGYLVPILESGSGHSKNSPDDEVMVCTLNAANEQEALNTTFSLTGLTDGTRITRPITCETANPQA
jgi:hypothetical protein